MIHVSSKIGRNESCPCGSGLKYKRCCLEKDQQQGRRSRIPGLGQIPGVGVLFSSKDVSRGENELLIVVTPEIVSPLDGEDAPPLLPGMEVTEPNDFDLYWRNQIEGREDHHYRSTVWPVYQDKLIHPRHYLRSEAHYIGGPVGLSD